MGVAVLVSLVAVVAGYSSGRSAEPATPIPSIHAEDLREQTIYESRQDPGYTAWVGAWVMPDGALMVGFTQATGPVDPAQRKPAPAGLLEDLGVTDPRRDFWGLDLASKYLRSTDGGMTWEPFRSDPFQATYPQAYSSQPTIALDDGTIVRRVNGNDLQDPTMPPTAYLERLAPGAERWGEPQVLMDPERYTYELGRIGRLSDGRLIATGNYWKVPADTPPSERAGAPSTYMLMVSSDEGETWDNALTIPPETGYLLGNEWDTAELPNGDLVAVMRTADSPETETPVRKQAILEQEGDGWVLTDLGPAPFPHSGHPELLATDEGPILHIATSGVHYTKDGRTWTPLEFPNGSQYESSYYPRAVQTDDGVVHVFGHVGGDDEYGAGDQSIAMDSFRLVAEP